MSTLSPTITIGKPHAGRGGDDVRPPSGGGETMVAAMVATILADYDAPG